MDDRDQRQRWKLDPVSAGLAAYGLIVLCLMAMSLAGIMA
jgi:hypothetical protein